MGVELIGKIRLLRRGLGPAHRRPFQFNAVRIVQQTVVDGAGLVRIPADVVPVPLLGVARVHRNPFQKEGNAARDSRISVCTRYPGV